MGGGCRWSGYGTNPEVSPMGEMRVRSVGLEQQLRSITSDSGLGAELHVWKAAESAPGSVACLVRDRVESPIGIKEHWGG